MTRSASAISALLILGLLGAVGAGAAEGDAKRGLYISKAAGCVGCHTEDKTGSPQYAGGRGLKTAFGTFYGPNITPHPESGIGRWTEADFVRALRHGVRPDGSAYYAAFPYTSFTGMAEQDMRDLWAYLRSVPANDRKNTPHELGFPYSFRPLAKIWQWLFFTPGPVTDDAKLTPQQNRGRYLTTALGHCGECHTPRNFLGAMRSERMLAGGKGPEDRKIPNLTPARLKAWTDAELKHFFQTGETRDGESASQMMVEVVNNTTSQLTPADLEAIISYLRVLPEVAEEKDK